MPIKKFKPASVKLDAKIQARQWLLNAIQSHSCIPNKAAEREIRRFIKRLQRDIHSLKSQRAVLVLAERKF